MAAISSSTSASTTATSFDDFVIVPEIPKYSEAFCKAFEEGHLSIDELPFCQLPEEEGAVPQMEFPVMRTTLSGQPAVLFHLTAQYTERAAPVRTSGLIRCKRVSQDRVAQTILALSPDLEDSNWVRGTFFGNHIVFRSLLAAKSWDFFPTPESGKLELIPALLNARFGDKILISPPYVSRGMWKDALARSDELRENFQANPLNRHGFIHKLRDPSTFPKIPDELRPKLEALVAEVGDNKEDV